MAKFSGKTAPVQKVSVSGPVRTRTKTPDALTYEGGAGYTLDAKSALFTLAATNMSGENTFYEEAGKRDARFRDLVHQVTRDDPAWVAQFVPYLRGTMNMRSAAVVMAAEFARASLDLDATAGKRTDKHPSIRNVIDSACQRPDEPAELLGYWLQTYGRSLPAPVKRGLGDAARRLYTERALLKYDGASRAVRFADVIELCHVKPRSDWQSALFRYAIDRRHNRDDARVGPRLHTITNQQSLLAVPVEKRRAMLDHPQGIDDILAKAGMTWESLSGWLQGPMDAKAWEAVIPSMGAMALTRNLRNFDEARIGPEAIALVSQRLSDAEEIARSRQFPFRFWTAYREVATTRWAPVLEQAVRHAASNVPYLGGRTLVLVDVSGSMEHSVSARSSVRNWEVGAVFGAIMATACDEVRLVPFATDSTRLDVPKGSDVLPIVQKVQQIVTSQKLQHGTNIWTAVSKHYASHDRIAIFTDMQTFDDYGSPAPSLYGGARAKADYPCPIYAWDLGGYGTTAMPLGTGRYQLAGFSDAAFRMLDLLERTDPSAGRWPWEA